MAQNHSTLVVKNFTYMTLKLKLVSQQWDI